MQNDIERFNQLIGELTSHSDSIADSGVLDPKVRDAILRVLHCIVLDPNRVCHGHTLGIHRPTMRTFVSHGCKGHKTASARRAFCSMHG